MKYSADHTEGFELDSVGNGEPLMVLGREYAKIGSMALKEGLGKAVLFTPVSSVTRIVAGI